MLIRRLSITKISSALCSFGIWWHECCTSSKSVNHGFHWDMLTRSLYLTKISQPCFHSDILTRRLYITKNQLSIVFIGICWPEGCTSPKSVNYGFHSDILTRSLYITKNQSNMWSFGICWPEGWTSPESVKHCVYWDILTRRLYITKGSQTLCSLKYVDPKAVHHQKSIKHCVYWDILTRRLYITTHQSTLCSLGYVDPKVVPHKNQSNIVFIGICWPEGCTSQKSVKHCAHWDMLIRRLYLTRISQMLCSLEYAYLQIVPPQNQLSVVLNQICWPEGCTYVGEVSPK